MADPVSLALGAASLATGLLGSRKADKRAKRAANEQAALTFEQRQEEIRQTRQANQMTRSMGRAAAYGSNLQMSGTTQKYLDAMRYENVREVAWAERAAEQERAAIRAGARGAGDSILYQSIGQALSYGIQGLFRE